MKEENLSNDGREALGSSSEVSAAVMRQRAALASFWEEVKQLDLPEWKDGLSNRDHDLILYGGAESLESGGE
jgi:hypothetical protein